VFDPAIMRLRARVTAAIDASLPDAAASVRIRLNSGKVLTKTIMHARGSLENPLSDAELESKLRESARRSGGKWAVDRIIESVWRLETLQTVAPLIPEEER
jgi:2-methylcitrate dehydratase PrpD